MRRIAGWMVAGLALVQTVLLLSAETRPPVAYVYKPVKIVAGGYIPGLVYHPAQKGLIYARADMGGAYRYDASKRRWIPLTDWTRLDEGNNLGIESIGIDPRDPAKLYIAVGMYTNQWTPNGFVLRSNDQGRTFQKASLPIKMGGNEDGRSSGERLAVDPGNGNVVYFGSRHNGLWISENGAVSWRKVESFPACADNGIGVIAELFPPHARREKSPDGAAKLTSRFYVAVSAKDGGVFQTMDGGKSWQKAPGQPTGLLVTKAAMASDGTIYATFADQPGPNGLSNGAVWKFDTNSGAWTEITPMKPGAAKDTPRFGYAGVAVSPRHPREVLVSTLNRWSLGDAVYRSTDAGQHWTDIADARQPRNASPSPWVGRPAGEAMGTGPWPTALAIDPFDDKHVLFGTGETIWETRDADALEKGGLVHWKVGADGIEETATIDLLSPPVGPHLFSAVGDIGGFRHDDFSVSPVHGADANPRFSNTNSYAFATRNPSLMARVGKTWSGNIYGAISQDQGVSWKPFASQPANTKGGGSVALSADGSAMVWASEAAPVSFSKDLGASWTASALPAPVQLAQVVSDPVEPGRFYLFELEAGAVLLSTDGGASFSAYASGLPKAGAWDNARLMAAPGRSADLWIALPSGLYRSAAAGQPFAPVAGVEKAHAVGFGMAAPGTAYPALYLVGRIAGVTDAYRSVDGGASWSSISDDAHRYGVIDVIDGDPRIFGRVYLGTEGRGVLYGDPAGR